MHSGHFFVLQSFELFFPTHESWMYLFLGLSSHEIDSLCL